MSAVDPSLFPILQRYTRFSVAALATFVFGNGACPSPPFNAPLVAHFQNTPTDTQVAIFRDDPEQEFILSFPGSSSLEDFITDFAALPVPYTFPGTKCANCTVHLGLNTAWNSVADQTIDTLANLTAAYPKYHIVITGHSLGGALAGIAYPSLKPTSLPIQAVYTFGQFRIGNQAFADYVDGVSGTTEDVVGEYYRVTHHRDGVPNLPSQGPSYQHSRTEFYELDDASSGGNQTAGTTFRCFGQEAGDCNKGAARGFINQDHLMYTGIQMTDGAECGLEGGL